MKIVSWNVNGYRSVLSKKKDGSKTTDNIDNVLSSVIEEFQPDILCLQEVKCSGNNLKDFDLYRRKFPYIYVNYSTIKKGYSGVACFSKQEPLHVHHDMLDNDYAAFLQEGRLLTLEFDNYFVVNCYTVNSKQKLERLQQRVDEWDVSFRNFIKKLQKSKSVIIVGDMNVAHDEIDIHTVKGHKKSAGFTQEERDSFTKLINECKLIDTYRFHNPHKEEYTYFSNFAHSRDKNKGWRIDYALVSEQLKSKTINSSIHKEYFGSDHVPIMLNISL